MSPSALQTRFFQRSNSSSSPSVVLITRQVSKKGSEWCVKGLVGDTRVVHWHGLRRPYFYLYCVGDRSTSGLYLPFCVWYSYLLILCCCLLHSLYRVSSLISWKGLLKFFRDVCIENWIQDFLLLMWLGWEFYRFYFLPLLLRTIPTPLWSSVCIERPPLHFTTSVRPFIKPSRTILIFIWMVYWIINMRTRN